MSEPVYLSNIQEVDTNPVSKIESCLYDTEFADCTSRIGDFL
jgi:hypothetical protein